MAPGKIVIYLLNGFSNSSPIKYSSAAALYNTYDKETLNTWKDQKSDEAAFLSVEKDSLFTWEGRSFDLSFNTGKNIFRFRFMIPLPADFTPVRTATVTKDKTTVKVRLRQTVSENCVAGAAAQIYRDEKTGVDTVVGPLLTIYRADNGGIKHGKGLQHIFGRDNLDWLRVYYCTADEPRHFNLETIQHDPEGHESHVQAGQESQVQAGQMRRRVVANATLLSEVMTSRRESSERSESIAEQPADNDENQDMLLALGEELKVEDEEGEVPNEGVLSEF